MASNDVRDVLNLPTDGLAPRPSKKQKIAVPKSSLKGLAREVQNLGGDTPIAIVPEVSLYKKRRLANRKPAAKWELRPFKNSAREDGTLTLKHWRRKTEAEPGQVNGDATGGEDANGVPAENGESTAPKEPELEDSAFAKFDVKVQLWEYNEEQYNAKLQSDEWTKDETDYLMQLVKDFDIRWPLIWDRYEYSPKPPEDAEMNGANTAVVPLPKPRTMEDLKARYYEVQVKIMEVQKPMKYMTQSEWDLHNVMLNFNPEQERQRKKFALASMSRSKDEAKEEESLLIEVKRIMTRAERFNEERRELYQRLDYPHSDQDISAFKGSSGLNNLLAHLQTQSQAKKRKPITGPEGASPAGQGPNGQPSSAVSEAPPSRRDSIAAQSAGHRESIGAEKPTPIGNKKGQPPPERRKLSEYEEQIYGVSAPERLSSGPTFRYERVNKLFSHKSGQQQQRIQNVLNELEIPVRLNMPTATVVAEYEKLVVAVTQLVDLRKQRDKSDGEVKVEEAKRAERAKARSVLGMDGANDEPPANKDDAVKPATETSSAKELDGKSNDNTDKGTNVAAPAPAKPDPADGDTQQQKEDASGAAEGADTSTVNGNGETTPTVVKKEEGGRPGSSHGPRNKRSASVLSAASDKSNRSTKSAKRQKK